LKTADDGVVDSAENDRLEVLLLSLL